MKIQNTTTKQSMLLKLKLFQTKTYLKKNMFTQLKVEDVECRLKKGLQVISKYHASGRKILFVGNLSPVEEVVLKKLLKKTKHMFVPERLWSKGALINKQSAQVNFSKRNSFYDTSQLKTSSNLILGLNCSIKNSIVVESYQAKIPMIALGNNLNIFDVKSSYKIPSNPRISKKKVKNNLFLNLCKKFLKKSIRRVSLNKKFKK